MTEQRALKSPVEPNYRAYNALLSLAGKAAVVTGGAGGLGLQIARRLGEAGATIVLLDLEQMRERAEVAIADLQAAGINTIFEPVDITDASNVEAAAAKINTSIGSPDIWVNNAGVFPRADILGLEPAKWRQVLDINLNGAFYGAQAAANSMKANGKSGVIINISSTAAVNPSGGVNSAHYVASKHGVDGLTKSLATELGKDDIRAVAVAPSAMWTPPLRAEYEEAGPSGRALDDYLQSRMPMDRFAWPDEVAQVVLFAASDMASFVSGSTILVDGGNIAAG